LRKIIVLVFAAATLWYLTLGGGLRRYEEYRVGEALRATGLSGHRADCMARRMVKRLSLAQLWKLQRLAGHEHSLDGALRATRRVDDDQAIAVTAKAAMLCASGLAH
jgi:hypothetical protein